jgi:hypothetical protein
MDRLRVAPAFGSAHPAVPAADGARAKAVPMIPRSHPAGGPSLGPPAQKADPLATREEGGRSLLTFLRLGRPASPVQIGDRFRKAGDQFGKVWEVARIWTTVDGLLHVRLRSLDRQGESRIISVITLMDRDFFFPVQPPPERD